MKLFKKHYEKILFIVFLVLFVILFGFQTYSVLSQQDEQPEEKLKINLGRPDYKIIDFDNEKYRSKAVFAKNSVRIKGNPQLENMGIDLMIPPVLAKCPEGAHLIPITDFPENEKEKNKKCSFCGMQLRDVPLEKMDGLDAEGRAIDTDRDGIPDVDEIKLGLNPNNEQDAKLDRDEDGFTNLEEYRAKTEINNPRSRPSYAKKLYVKNIKESKVGIWITRFTGDTGKNEEDPEKWTVNITYNMKDKRGTVRVRSARLKIGRELKNAGNNSDTFVVDRIEPKFDDAAGGKVNVSTVVLKRVSDNLEFPAKVGQEVLDPSKEITYEVDLSFEKEKELVVMTGQEFKLGNEQTGVDTFVTTRAEVDLRARNPEDRMTARVMINNSPDNTDTVKTRTSGMSMYGEQDSMMGYPPGMAPQPMMPRPQYNMPTF